ncbi:MAG: DUF1761 domain-containing protein [Pseudomonadota bacterium]
MPKIAGVNLLGALLGGVAIYFVGFIWYGILFTEPWMQSNGMFFGDEAKTTLQWLTADGLQTVDNSGQPEPMVLLWGFVISIVLSLGLGWLIQKSGAKTHTGAIVLAVGVGVLVGLPLMAYDPVYTPFGTLTGLLVDGGHVLASFVAGAAVLSFFD